MRIGVLTGGGDCPGLNAVLRAVTKSLIRQCGAEVVGIEDGYLGLIEQRVRPLDWDAVSGILAAGGTVLGTHNRASPLQWQGRDHRDAVLRYARETLRLDAMVVIGGDGTMTIGHAMAAHGLPMVGVPKTIDNDLAVTDCCPGFGSAAKYTAVSVRECALDVAAMAETSTKVFVYEAMGRHAGWLAAAAGLAGEGKDDAPHIILFPERPFDEGDFLARVDAVVKRVGWCVVVASEGIRTADGTFVADAGGGKDSFGHTQLGGVASRLAGRVKDALGHKVHWALPDYLQRSARHLASQTDLDQAMAVGRAAVECALAGQNAVMPVIVRDGDAPYRWHVDIAPLARIANHEKTMPKGFIRKDGYGITAAGRRYLSPLVAGEAFPPFGRDGLPNYVTPVMTSVPRRLPAWRG